MSKTPAGRIVGVLDTQKNPIVASAVKAIGITYDHTAASHDPMGAAAAFITEAVNVLADNFASTVSKEAMARIQSKLKASGNSYHDNDVRKYVLSDVGFEVALTLLHQYSQVVIDFSGRDQSQENLKTDDHVNLHNDALITQLYRSVERIHDAGMTANGTFATALGVILKFALSHGADRTTLVSHLNQLVTGIISKRV